MIESDPVTFITSGTSWTVPSDWNSSSNSIEAIGGGGGSAGGGANAAGYGGGGGAYAEIINYPATPGQIVSIQVGTGGLGRNADGAIGGNGTDTSFGNTGTLLAKGGTGGPVSGKVGAAGGQALSVVGDFETLSGAN